MPPTAQMKKKELFLTKTPPIFSFCMHEYEKSASLESKEVASNDSASLKLRHSPIIIIFIGIVSTVLYSSFLSPHIAHYDSHYTVHNIGHFSQQTQTESN